MTIREVVIARGEEGFRAWVDEKRCVRFPINHLEEAEGAYRLTEWAKANPIAALAKAEMISEGIVSAPLEHRVVELDGPVFPEDHEPNITIPVGALQGNSLTVTQPTEDEKWKLAYAPMPDAPEWMGDELTGRQKTKLLISMDENPSLRAAMIEAGYGTEWTVRLLSKGQASQFMKALHGSNKDGPAKTEWSADAVVAALMYEKVA